MTLDGKKMKNIFSIPHSGDAAAGTATYNVDERFLSGPQKPNMWSRDSFIKTSIGPNRLWA